MQLHPKTRTEIEKWYRHELSYLALIRDAKLYLILNPTEKFV